MKKKIFDCEYPFDSAREISKWIDDVTIDKDGRLTPGCYKAKIIVEIVED